jgi:hypothetical protein
MNADDLRQVAREIREKATRCTAAWPNKLEKVYDGVYSIALPTLDADNPSDWDVRIRKEEGEHIAAWHPAVALAVADWLDDIAETIDLLVTRELPLHAWSMLWQTSREKAEAFVKAWRDEIE